MPVPGKFPVILAGVSMLFASMAHAAGRGVGSWLLDSTEEAVSVKRLKSEYVSLGPGHGPFIQCADPTVPNRVLWFWLSPDLESLETADWLDDTNKVVLVTFQDAENTDSMAVVWPARYRGAELESLFKEIYEGLR